MRAKCTHTLLAVAVAALLAMPMMSGCLAPSADDSPGLGSESHFLMSCFNESECGPGLGCICGICTVSCQSELQCSSARLGGSANEFSTLCSAEAGLGTAAICPPFAEPPGLCVAECAVDADCGSNSGAFVCDRQRCRDVNLPSNGLDPDAGDVPDAAVGDVVDASDAGSGADTDVDDLELVECDGDLISTREQLEILVGCERITSDLTIRDIALSSDDLAAIVDVQGSLRVLNVEVVADELRFDALRRVTEDFVVQAIDGARSRVAAPAIESAVNVDVSGLATAALDLASLSDIAGACVIADSDIGTIDMRALRSVAETLSLRDIRTLRVVSFPVLTSADSFEIEGLPELESIASERLAGVLAGLSLSGLSALVSVDIGSPTVSDSLRVQGMNTWTDLSALARVSSGENMSSIVLSENALLRAPTGFTMTPALAPGALLNVERNPRMVELGSLLDIATIGGGARISVSANARLPQCAISAWLVVASAELTEESVEDVASGNDETAVCE